MAKLNSNKFDSHGAVKSIVALFVAFIMFGIVALFSTYRDNIIDGNKFSAFVVLCTVALGLLMGLMYLVNPVNSLKAKKKKR